MLRVTLSILHSRLLRIQENLDHEPQCGFRPERGCIDAIYTIKIALKNAENMGKNHGSFFWTL